MSKNYSTRLCGCFGDLPTCLYGCCCPGCLNASNLAAIRKENCGLFHYCFGFRSYWIRQLIRNEYEFGSDECDDCIAVCFCHCCAICQDAREINNNLMKEIQNV